MSKNQSIIAVLIAICSIQFGAAVAKDIFSRSSAEGVAALRLFFASIILLITFRPWKKKVTGKALRSIMIYGSCLGLMNLLFYMALARIPLGVAVALEFVGPLGVALIFSRSRFDFLWGFLAIVGITLLLPIHSFSSNLDLTGVLLAIGAGICWGLYIIFGERAGRDVSGGQAASIGMLMAALVVVPFGLYDQGFNLLKSDILPLGIAIALLSSAIPYTLEMFALKKIPPKTFGIFMSLEPALAAVFGSIYLHEHLNLIQLIAIVCVAAASLGSSLTSKKEK